MKYIDEEGNVAYRSKSGFNFDKHKFVGFVEVNEVVKNAKDGVEKEE